MLKAKLLVVGGDAKTAEVKLRLPTVIGRGKEGVTLTLPHQLVSRKHTEIFEKDSYLFVRDLGSLNGTYVNNKRIAEPQILKPNELLTLGNVTFRAIYEVPEGAPIPAVMPPEEVKFEEVKSSPSTETQAQPEKEKETDEKLSEQVAAESTPSSAQSNGKQEVKSPEPTESEPVESKSVEKAASNSDQIPEKQAIDVLDESSEAESGSSKTDKSLIGLVLDEDVTNGVEKSISMSAIDGLPDGQAQVSFVGNVDFDGAESVAQEVEAIELDLGSEAKSDEASESSLGSFLKKLPK
jgi:pSer/pThr/pTyr-binding forkhead associated (FHA) protein